MQKRKISEALDVTETDADREQVKRIRTDKNDLFKVDTYRIIAY